MSQSTVQDEVNKKICESIGCFAKAAKEIEVHIGQQGKISLYLCNGCITKFQDG